MTTPVAEADSGSLLRPRVLVPFVAVALIWGSTWLVIKGQVGTVPPAWSVCWRFVIAALGMFALAAVRRDSLRLDRQGWLIAAGLGLAQFTMNFQFVYRAEQFITSGVVAVLYALLMVPNALLGRVLLKLPVSRGFLGGSAVALAGIALLLLHEVQLAPVGQMAGLGIVFALCGIGSASFANVLQATPAARGHPITTLLAWAMAIGAGGDALVAWVLSGPPQFDTHPAYLGGLLYLALVGSVVTFPLYFSLVRDMGPGRAAYNGVVVPVVAMTLSTLFEGYRWSLLAAAGSALAMLGLVLALRARKPSR